MAVPFGPPAVTLMSLFALKLHLKFDLPLDESLHLDNRSIYQNR
jgi:hypothetical protein